MRKIWVSLTIVILISSIFFLLDTDVQSIEEFNITRSSTIIVDQNGSGDFLTIQDAINFSTDGDLIRIYDGMYYGRIVVNRSLTIEGNGTINTYIDSNVSLSTVFISNPNVTIKNLTIRASNSLSFGLECYQANNLIFHDCNINNSNKGIRLSFTDDFTISNCNISSNSVGIEITSSSGKGNITSSWIETIDIGNGIYLGSENVRLRENILINCYILISSSLNIKNIDVDNSTTINQQPIFKIMNQNVIKVPINSPLILLYNCSNISIKNFTQDRNFQNYYLSECEDVFIENSIFYNKYRKLMNFYETDGIYIDNCSFSKRYGFVYFKNCNNISVKDSYFIEVYNPIHIHAIYGSNNIYGSFIKIENNEFIKCDSTAIYVASVVTK